MVLHRSAAMLEALRSADRAAARCGLGPIAATRCVPTPRARWCRNGLWPWVCAIHQGCTPQLTGLDGFLCPATPRATTWPGGCTPVARPRAIWSFRPTGRRPSRHAGDWGGKAEYSSDLPEQATPQRQTWPRHGVAQSFAIGQGLVQP